MSEHRFVQRLHEADFAPSRGRVHRVGFDRIETSGPDARLGDLCFLAPESDHEGPWLAAEVVDVAADGLTLVPLDRAAVRLGAQVELRPSQARFVVGDGFAGRAIDALGRPIDGGEPIAAGSRPAGSQNAPAPFSRRDPMQALETGIRAIDGLLTLGVGQRIGIFAASGVGKTSLLEQIAVQTAADRCVICLVGERGREVEAFWRQITARTDARRFTLVAATSDDSAPLRARAVDTALALADHWRARGEHVLLLADSMTRVAMALREMGLAAGAPPTVRAYTPNVFAALPRFVERCGAIEGGGAITAVMSVLSETDDVDDPIVEVMKSLLDGHIVLSRTLAERGHFPAIDVARSVSRLSARLVAKAHAEAAREVTARLAALEGARVMIESGVYAAGSNPLVDRALAMREATDRFLRQPQGVSVPLAETASTLVRLTEAATHG